MGPAPIDGIPTVYQAFASVKTLDFTRILGMDGFLGKEGARAGSVLKWESPPPSHLTVSTAQLKQTAAV
jgi:hypothetical protein